MPRVRALLTSPTSHSETATTIFFLPPLQNTLQEVFKGKKVYEGCIK